MSVYQKEYPKEFIDNLPVDFYKIKKTDFTYIPKGYYGLFKTDWNWGKYSKMEISLRMMYQEMYLEYQHTLVLASIEAKTPIEQERKVVGFIKD